MEQFNKALSFILGLVVVAVFIVVASGKFNIKGFNLPNTKIASKITPTVTPYMTPKPTSKPWFSFFSQPKATPTVTPKVNPTTKPTAVPKVITYTTSNTGTVQKQTQQDPNYKSYSGSNAPTSIPNTGIPIVLFPLFGASFVTGAFMKKAGKKE